MKTLDEWAQAVAEAEWEHDGVHPTFRLAPAQRHYAIAERIVAELTTPPGEGRSS